MPLRNTCQNSEDRAYYLDILTKYREMAQVQVDKKKAEAEKYRRRQSSRVEIDWSVRRRLSSENDNEESKGY